MSRLIELQNRIDNLSLRERGAIFLCILVLIYFFWDSLLMQPLHAKEKLVNSQLQQKQAEQFALNAELLKLDLRHKSDPNKADREKLRLLKSELQEVELQVRQSTKHLIAPKEMATMLEAVLQNIQGLELLQIKGLGATPIVEVKELQDEEALTDGINDKTLPVSVVENAYKHGLRIVFEGDYMNTLKYVEALENLGWGFFWESLELKVREYPDSIVTITVYTLSLDKNWIGV